MKTPIQQAAAAMGRAKSDRKASAARANGAKGGRPKKCNPGAILRHGKITLPTRKISALVPTSANH